MPLAVSDLSVCVICASKPISVVQLLKLCDLSPEKSNLCAKNFEVIHVIKDTSSGKSEHGVGQPEVFQKRLQT
jgi:hypothetical protein